MKTLLVIGYVWPEPKSSAAGSHMLSILMLFKCAGWRVIFSTPAQKTDYNCDLRGHAIETKDITLNCSSFDRYLMLINPTVVLFDRFLMEEQFGWRVAKFCPTAMRILDTEDLQFLRGARQSAIKEGREFSYQDLNCDLARREIASIYRSDLSFIISDFEYDLLTQYFNLDPDILLHLPFMIDANRSSLPFLGFEKRKHFVTIGNLRHQPNWDSILFLRQIWPSIRKILPDAEIHIYGAYTPPKAMALNNLSLGFIIKDRAENVAEVMQTARVCLSPLRFGAGLKGKFVDAMLTGTPCVTTAIGAEGMTMGKPWPGFVAETVDGLTDSAINLYQDKTLWLEKQSFCSDLVTSNFNKKTIGENLLVLVADKLESLGTLRQSNFIGSMLNFHTIRSTEYMSKWIEAKNKSN